MVPSGKSRLTGILAVPGMIGVSHTRGTQRTGNTVARGRPVAREAVLFLQSAPSHFYKLPCGPRAGILEEKRSFF
jgi:hypothetical protein